MKPVIITLILLPSLAFGDSSRDQLISECRRGFESSCRTLRLENLNPVPGPSLSQSTIDQLQAECRRGFSSSCEALKGAYGETPRHRTICTDTGYASRGGVYNGTEVCRESRE